MEEIYYSSDKPVKWLSRGVVCADCDKLATITVENQKGNKYYLCDECCAKEFGEVPEKEN